MAKVKTSGSKPSKKKESLSSSTTLRCLSCNKVCDSGDFYNSDSGLYESIGKIPYCKSCLEKFYQHYLKECKKAEYTSPERKAVERICMTLDIYYSDDILDSVMEQLETKRTDATLIILYIKQVKLYQYRKKNYDTTLQERYLKIKNDNFVMSDYEEQVTERSENIQKAEKFFGTGFTDEDYLYLYEQYNDWTARHECETKSQEEIFKRLCFTQLELLKATRNKEDTKDLNATYLKQLEAAKLQPKQNKGETVSDTQTFGTLIDKWENTRPVPEIDEDLKDVDKIGKYINIFFKGHLSRMMGIKNAPCKAYDDFMKQFSVKKPEYESDDGDSEALFDALFGGDLG